MTEPADAPLAAADADPPSPDDVRFGGFDQPYTYEVTHHAGPLAATFADLEPGSETGTEVAVAGRLMLLRVQGKLAFGTLADSTGRMQLFAPSATTPAFDQFCELNLGDWIGVRGEVMTTRRGELSVRVDDWS
ncbi:MAG: OB-fold nucleic acid binding domain-containing protein, partial [Actinomycetes bacterium]